jgi:cytochrome c-type biogenesis protein CcmE
MSKKLDDELAQVAGLDDNEAKDGSGGAAPPTVQPIAAEPSRRKNTNFGLLAVLLVMGGALVLLFMWGFKDAAIYATPVEDLLSKQDDLHGRKVRVDGELVPGTLVRRDKPCEYRFTIHGKTSTEKQLNVSYPQCVIPDTFRDVPGGGVQVTIEGALNKSTGNFEATLVMAKCSSKYDPTKHEMKPGDAQAQGMPVN